MAANITIGSLVSDSAGLVITGTLSGGAGGYEPASGVTGILVTSGGYLRAQASATISGSTVTITLDFPLTPSETTTIDVAVESNITDSSANTAQGQTGVSVTNNSAAEIATHSLGDSGGVTSSIAAVCGGYAFQNVFGIMTGLAVDYDGEIRVGFTGTGLALSTALYTGGVYDVTATPVGGGDAVTNVATFVGLSSTTLKGRQVLISGLDQGDWEAVIKLRGGAGFFFVDLSTSLLAVGDDAAFFKPSNFGTLLGTLANPTRFVCDGDNLLDSGQSSPVMAHRLGRLRFRSNASSFQTWSYLPPNQRAILYCDGAQLGGVITAPSAPANHNNGFWTVASGLDTGSYHTYEIEGLNGGTFREFMFFGGGVDTSTDLTPRAALVTIGDSNTQGETGITSDESYPHLVGKTLMVPVANRGISGNKVADVLARLADIFNLTPDPFATTTMIGTNDDGATGAPTDQATFQADYQDMIEQICDEWPLVTHRFLLIPQDGGVPGSERATYNGLIADAFTAAARSNSKLVDTTDWHAGGVHLNAAEHAVFAEFLVAELSPAPSGNAVQKLSLGLRLGL